VPPVRLYPAAGNRLGHPGVDPAGRGECGRRTGRDGRGRAGRAQPRRDHSAQSSAGPAGGAAAGSRDVATAAEWTAERGLRADDAPDYPREGWYLVLARVLLAQDRPDHSLGLLERLRGLAIAQGRTGSIAPTRPPPTCHWIIWPGYYTPSTPNQPRRAPARRSPPRPA
jgi:hypothetical protein